MEDGSAARKVEAGRSDDTQDAFFKSIDVGEADHNLSLVILKNHYSRDGEELLTDVFEQLTPAVVLLDTANSPEGQLVLRYAQQTGSVVLDFSAPPFSLTMLRKVGLMPRQFLKFLFGEMLLTQEPRLLEIMRKEAAAINLNSGVIHSLIAQFNVELLANRRQFSEENYRINQLFTLALADLNWHRYKSLQLEGEVLGVFVSPFHQIFEPDYQPQIEFSPEELKAIDLEIEEYYQRIEGDGAQPSREESILFVHGVLDDLDPDEIKRELIEGDNGQAVLDRLVEEYNRFMKSKEFLMAARRARLLVEVGAQGPKDLLAPALTEQVQQLAALYEYPLAGLVAEIMREFGLNEAWQFMDEASREYWNLLNLFTQNFSTIEVNQPSAGVDEHQMNAMQVRSEQEEVKPAGDDVPWFAQS